jgi:hypothetical protein
MTIVRRNHGRYHSYVDTDSGLKVPGVTKLTGDGIPKPFLVDWAANTTADYALDNWDSLAQMAPSARLKELRGARYADRDKAGNRGTQVHKLAQKLVAGDRVAVPDELAGHVESYVRFLDEFDVTPILVEATVASHTHRYCGTLDLIADLLDPDDPERGPSVRWLLDVKTSRSGVFGETALQLAGYRYADVYLDEVGEECEMLQVERTGAVHVRADGYDLMPVEAGELQHRQLLYAQQIGQFVADSRDLIGEPVISPHTSAFRLVRDEASA